MFLRLLLFAILAFVLWRVGGRLFKGIIDGMGYRSPHWKPESLGLVRDPMCGRFVLPSKALMSGTGADTRYFCSEKCRQDYVRHA